MSKKPYHRFNRNLDEPEVVETKAQPGSNQIAAPTFAAELELLEHGAPIAPTSIVPDADHLKFLFGELGDLLAQDRGVSEEAINTNPVPMEPTIQNPPSTMQPVAEPTPPVDEDEEDEDAKNPATTPPPVPETPVTEAKVADFHEVADNLTRPYRAPEPTPAPVAVPVPPPAPVVVQQKTGWVFTVHRNKITNLIERIEADPKPLA